MALYAIGDLHLSLGTDKPMNVFGGRWENYTEKIISGFSTLSDEDVCVICGDLSWAMNLEEAKEDFLFIHKLPGKKIILKGNHDYWWTTAKKIYAFFDSMGIGDIKSFITIAFFMGILLFAGPEGGSFEEEKEYRERPEGHASRGQAGLKHRSRRPATEKNSFYLHYPPKFAGYECYIVYLNC
jgi:predicted phosphohydrolase